MPSDPITAPPSKRRWIALGTLATIVPAISAAVIYSRSRALRQVVGSEGVAQLERVTGGSVEVGSISWDLSSLQVDINDLTIHGKEKPGDIPYAHFNRAHIRLKIISIF